MTIPRFRIRPPQFRLGKGTAVLALALATVGGYEGVRTVAYRDTGGVPTVCFGETHGVHMGDRYTLAECKAMLGDRLAKVESGMRSCLASPDALPAKTYVAFLSFTYNVGVGAFCSSTLHRKANAGDLVGACDELLKWDHDNGRVVRGLTVRREGERRLCLEGVR